MSGDDLIDIYNFSKEVKYSGIQRDKAMSDKLMYIPNDDTQKYPYYRLYVVVETFGHLT